MCLGKWNHENKQKQEPLFKSDLQESSTLSSTVQMPINSSITKEKVFSTKHQQEPPKEKLTTVPSF